MNSETAVSLTFAQSPTFLIQVEGFSPTHRREKCRVTFLDAETSSVLAAHSFDSGFVSQASLGQLMNIMGVGCRYRSVCVEQATRALHLATLDVSRALARSTQRPPQLKDSGALESRGTSRSRSSDP